MSKEKSDTSGLVENTDCNREITEIKNKILDVKDFKKTNYGTKITESGYKVANITGLVSYQN